ncbi:hypothetical protein GCM10022409_10330 [Hymenobacter glaciei]|uniref:histidine kinase n=2 Tax=Hymenobacter glaciei TaxID=877209 RepID=A0ABP7TLW1_9BACT
MPSSGSLTGRGPMADLVYAKDWSTTPLGAIEGWPQSLRTTVSLCLASNFPINIAWGPQRIQIYNDGYLPLCADKHPTSLGQDFKECWASAWEVIGEAFEQAAAGQTRFLENQRMFLDRYGYLEETFFTFSFSPILDESGGVGGLFHPVTELTQQTLAERRLNILRAVPERTSGAQTEQEAAGLLLDTLREFALDLPFVALYSTSPDGQLVARLEGQVGLEGAGALAPATVGLAQDAAAAWPLAAAALTGQAQRVEALAAAFGAFASGPYPEAPHTALVYPLYRADAAQPAYFVVLGVSARRALDAEYTHFYDILVAAVSTAMTRARTLEDERKRADALTELNRAGEEINVEGLARLRVANEELKKFKVLSDNAFDAFILMREDGSFAYLNELACQRWGYTAEEAQTLRVPDVDPLYQAAEFQALFARVQQQGSLPPFETIHQRRDGSRFPVEVSLGPITLSGQPHLFAVARDITQQVAAKQQLVASEQRYRTLIEESPIAMALYVGPDLRIQHANALMLMYWGKDASVVGKSFREALPELDDQPFSSRLEQVYATGQPYTGVRQEATVLIDGQPRTSYFTFTFKPLRDEQGQVYGIHNTAMDVNTEMQALQQIEESEARFRALVEQSPVPTALTRGLDLVIESINAPMLHLMGFQTAEEVVGRAMVDVLPQLQSEAVLQIAKEVTASGEAFRGSEMPVIMPGDTGDLEQRYYNVSYTPLIEGGQVTGLIHVAIDVTEQVRARRKIEAEKARAQLAIEVGGLGVFETEFTTFEIVADQRFNEIFGFDGPQSRQRYLSVFHPDDLAQRAQALELGVKTGAFEYEVRFIHAITQQVRWVRIRGRVSRDAAGAPATVVGVAQDTTEQKTYTEALHESEQRFRILADAAPNMVWAVNPDGTIRYINRAFTDFVGVTQQEYEATGWGPYMHPDELQQAQDTLAETIRAGSRYKLEHRMLRHDGQFRWLLAQGAPSYYASGELYGYVGSAIDITDLKETNEQLVRTNRDLDNFIYTASHDLKAPISNIEGLLLLLGDLLPAELRTNETLLPVLTRMQDSVERFTRTIAHLTEVSKLQMEFAHPPTATPLLPLLEDVRQDLRPLLTETGGQIRVDAEGCPTMMMSEKNLRSILYNLVSNALKYHHPDRPPVVRVSCRAEGDRHVLRVQDNGLGLAEWQQTKLFQLFERLHTHVEGTGVGLYMVKKMVENAGGTISVDSREGEGTTFTAAFPA